MLRKGSLLDQFDEAKAVSDEAVATSDETLGVHRVTLALEYQ